MTMKRTSRILAAITLAMDRNPSAIESASGLTELRINIKFDQDGKPCRVFLTPQLESFIVSKSIEGFTFPVT